MSGGLRMSVADLAQTRAWADPRNRERIAEAAGLAGPMVARNGTAREAPAGHREAGFAPASSAIGPEPSREPRTEEADFPATHLARYPGTTPAGLPCLEFTVPTAPRGWQRDTPLGYGRSAKTAAEAAYQRDIAKYARQARAAIGGMPLIRGGVRLSVVAHLEVPKSYGKAKRADCLAGRILPILKPDFDNIAKSVADALTGVLWVDDKQVVAGSCLKVWAETPSLYVRVQAL